MTQLPTHHPAPFKSGFVAIIGAPNAGKSTLINGLVEEKIAITAPKPQTTRSRVLGVVHRPHAQIVLLDTPGIHPATKAINKRMVATALAALEEADTLIWVADLAHPNPAAESLIAGQLKAVKTPVILALNKCDLVAQAAILEGLAKWRDVHAFAALVPVSARTGLQIDDLIGAVEKQLRPGPPFYPPDTLTDQSLRQLAAERVREKIIHLCGQEIPYAAAVTVEAYKEDDKANRVVIEASIHVEKPSQKAIIIGRGAQQLKRIGTAARQDIEAMTGRKAFLNLFVRVQKNWTKDPRALNRFGC
jgi:GTP-binding protein Era